jgi:predicted nucleic acid-binding protein
MAWCFEDERQPSTDELFRRLATSSAVVPQIWPLEVANVLALAVRKSRLTVAQRTQFVSVLESAAIQVDGSTALNAFSKITALADAHRLTVYDASYLELAMRFGVPLATLDRELRVAAAAVDVKFL